MGIDIGYIDLVCQINSPRSIAAFLGSALAGQGMLQDACRRRSVRATRDELREGLR